MLPRSIVASVSAIEDFPVPGGPKRKIERPLLIAGRLLGKHEVLERLADLIEGDRQAPDGLRTNAIDVRRERDRGSADVAVLGERLARALLAFCGDDVDVRRGRGARAALDLDEVLSLEELEDGLEDLGEREADHVGEVGRGGLTLLIKDLQDEVRDERLGESGLLDRDGRDRGGSFRG
jgi:hypothetical protein